MSRLMVAGVCALILHGLLFQVQADWLKTGEVPKHVSHPLTVSLSYMSPKLPPQPRPVSLPEKPLLAPKEPEQVSKAVSTTEPPETNPIKDQSLPQQIPHEPAPVKTTKPMVAKKKPPQPVVRKPAPVPARTELRTRDAETVPTQTQPITTTSRATETIQPQQGNDVTSAERAAATPPPSTPSAPAVPSSAPMIREAVPLYKNNPPPKYPAHAKRRGYEGTVLLAVLVDVTGKVKTVDVSVSSGHSVLDKAALNAVRTWLFEPGKRGNEAIEMQVTIPIRFRIE